MARLNDPPVPVAESLDALKRRFIRQNREIARVNSTQSQRIRNLEIEISRLLAENISLREQAITAAAEAEKWRIANRLGKDVVELKSRLESKLSEVNALVEELGSLPDKAMRRSSVRRRKSGLVQDLATSPNERDWRNRQTLGSLLSAERDAQEGRLPAILEDKYYPRRTLESEELRILTAAANISNEDTESPDLGPPPVVHFEDAEPIAFDSTKSPKRVSGGIVHWEDELASIPKNLETRRKRRTSSLLQHNPGTPAEGNQVEPSEDDSSLLPPKMSTKRKFDVTDMEVRNPQILANDGFEFSRKESTAAPRPKPSRFTPKPSIQEQPTQVGIKIESPEKSSEPRQVLAPKSTNSPTKRPVRINQEKRKDARAHEEHGYSGVPVRRTTTSNLNNVLNGNEDQNFACAPRTPAPIVNDLFSPPSSTTDAVPKLKSTEAAITNSVEDVLNGSIGRGSRRARAAVSYAEPNLRDKMRRPDKKLVGAVEGIGKPSTASDKESDSGTARAKSDESAPSMRIVKIKSEKKLGNEDERWKTLPHASAGVQDEATSPLQDRKKPLIPNPSDMRRKRTLSEAEDTKPKVASIPNVAEDDLDKAVSRLSIFDPPPSSPISADSQDVAPKELDKSSLSTIPHRKASGLAAGAKPTSAATSKSRRYSAQPSANTAIDISGKENISLGSSKLKRANSVQALSKTSAQAQVHDLAPVQTSEKTLGSRRRSMMV